MNQVKIFTLLIIIISVVNPNYGQTILDLYFGGNKDKLIEEAEKLIHLPEPTFKHTFHPLDTNAVINVGVELEKMYASEKRFFVVRDHNKIFAYRFGKHANVTILFIHGVGSSAYAHYKTAALLHETTKAEVYAIDLRGHGQSEGKAGDVTYINQYADDIADIIKEIKGERPEQKIILAGHSMGGGITLRYAMEDHYPAVDGFLLLAPLLGHNSPAFQETEQTEKVNSDGFMKIHMERIIGLTMLNEIEHHEYDSLAVLFLNRPDHVSLRKYSFRANKSMAPEDYASGLQSVNKPMLVLMGSKDEAFSAVATKEAVLKYSGADMHIIEGATHNEITHNEQCLTFIKHWISTL